MLFRQEERVSTSLSSDLPGSRPTPFWAREYITLARSRSGPLSYLHECLFTYLKAYLLIFSIVYFLNKLYVICLE